MSWLDDWVDWHPGTVPDNVELGEGAVIETTYSLSGYRSELECGLRLGDDAAVWNPSMLYVGPHGRVEIGAVTCVNQSFIEANELVRIGAYVNIAWGTVISDSFVDRPIDVATRRVHLMAVSHRDDRWLGTPARTAPVVIEDDAWIGFDAVVGPGVTVGRGAIVGARSWVVDDVAPYTVVAGAPARVVGTAPP